MTVDPESPEQAKNVDANRRSHPRQRAKGEVVCRGGHGGMGPEITGTLFDLSQSGAGVRLSKQMDPGDELEIEFLGVGSSRKIRARAVVRQVKQDSDAGKWLIGCQFEKRISYQDCIGFTR